MTHIACIVCSEAPFITHMHTHTHMHTGLNVFQGYIEWSVSSSAIVYVQQVLRQTTGAPTTADVLGVTSSGLAFYAANTMLRDAERGGGGGGRGREGSAPSLASTLQTLQSVSAIMFTNSLVNFAMQIISPGGGGVQQELAAVAAGLVVARTVVQITDAF